MKRALICGITGQDGSYLAELLLQKGYEVHGIIRRSSTFNTDRIDGIYQDPHEAGTRLFLHYGDLSDGTGLRRILEMVKPDEVYNLGAQSHVRVSFDQPEYTADVVATGTLRMLEALRDYMNISGHQAKFYQAGSSEMFGSAPPPQSELTPFHPRSPYGASKAAAHYYTLNYREAFGMFACNGILFNHESPRRGETFVTRKITRAIGRIKHGLQDKLFLGNLDTHRDWGYAGDFVQAMWLMLQQDEPGDYVVSTGESHTVREFLDIGFGCAEMDWSKYVEIDPKYFRPSEVDFLLGDSTRARQKLGWEPTVDFESLVKMMVEHDLDMARREVALVDAGHTVSLNGRLR